MRQAAALLCVAALLVSGCRSSNELNAMSLVMGIAVDKGEQESEYEVTVQIANAAAHSGGSANSGGADIGEAYMNITARGTGVSDAMHEISRMLNRKLYTGHIQVVVIGLAVAQDGIGPILNYLIGSADGRLSTILLIAGNKASDMFNENDPMKQSPADNLAGLIDAQVKAGVAAKPTMLAFLNDMAGGLTASKIPVVEMKKGENDEEFAEITGVAAFDGMKLKDIMSTGQAQAVLAVRNQARGGYQQIIKDEGYLTLRIEKASSHVRAAVTDGTPRVTVVLQREYSVDDSTLDIDFLDDDERRCAEQLSKEKTLEQLCGALAWAKERQLDVFAFGEHLYRYCDAETRELLRDWQTAFPELEVAFELDVTILGTVAILKSLKPAVQR